MNLLSTPELDATIKKLATTLTQKKWFLCTAESCTGGWVSATLTSFAGSSEWFERGFVTYSNEAKQESLGIPHQLITEHGAVSQAVALAMAEGALLNSHAHWSISITGIAGPTGGTVEKPVGLVWFGFSHRPDVNMKTHFHSQTIRLEFPGHRQAIRFAAVKFATEEISKCVASSGLIVNK